LQDMNPPSRIDPVVIRKGRCSLPQFQTRFPCKPLNGGIVICHMLNCVRQYAENHPKFIVLKPAYGLKVVAREQSDLSRIMQLSQKSA
ncbi:hypothetical protein, partial [Roseibaca sp. Y0-43]|uniref:hypothetical protein n=1 Tax=Roseibaca sp. Y0-43 TaxID=2816854 RepID=UPI001D0C83F2